MKATVWKNRRYVNDIEVDDYNTPWEIDAYGREIGLWVGFCQQKGWEWN
jgi:hypothetical protein